MYWAVSTKMHLLITHLVIIYFAYQQCKSRNKRSQCTTFGVVPLALQALAST